MQHSVTKQPPRKGGVQAVMIRHLYKWLVAGPGLHPSTAATGCAWLLRQGQWMVIIYEAWSRSITTDWKSLPVCKGRSLVGSANPGTTVPHLLAIHFDQLAKTQCVFACGSVCVFAPKTSSSDRLK